VIVGLNFAIKLFEFEGTRVNHTSLVIIFAK